MKIALDLQLAVGTGTGIGEYATGLFAGLRARGADVVALSFPQLDPWRFDRRVLWDQVLLPAQAARSGAQLLHCTSGTMPLVRAKPSVVTVHDLAWLRAQSHVRAYARWYFGAFALARYASARRIVVDSEFSRGELLEYVRVPADRVAVVYPGVAEDYCTLARAPASQPFLLSVGTIERRKNLAVIVRALAKLPQEVRLVVAGPTTPYEIECRELAASLGVNSRITWRGYVTRAELLELYAGATAIVVPSTYEGFGYAAAQALCAAVPVCVSNCTSLPEIVAGDVEPLDPHDEEQWSAQIAAILGDRAAADARAAHLRAGAIARFAWPASVSKMLAVYAAALG